MSILSPSIPLLPKRAFVLPKPEEAERPVEQKQQKESSLNETDKKVIRVASYVVGTLVLGGIGFLIGRRIYRKHNARQSNKDSLIDNTTENFAKRLKMAFDNDGFWGTDVEAVRKVFRDIPTMNDFKKVITEYRKQNSGADLVADLQSELTTSEYYEMQSILKGKPTTKGKPKDFDVNSAISIAHRLKAAFDYTVVGMPATDTEAVREALNDVPSLYAFAMVKVVYKKEYGTEVEDDLNSELDIFDFDWKAIIYNKPKR